ncbi:MAG: hypothetical protein FJ009_21100 [Chloroflexi bacterium]|nr:hypothetical protein [Chloroflexota bacterium]
MSTVNLARTESNVKPGVVTQREINRRVYALYYTKLADTVQDAEDAVAYGLQVAYEHWKGDAPLWAYVWIVAKHRLLGNRRRVDHRMQMTFSDITEGTDADLSEVVNRFAPDPLSIYTDREIDAGLLELIRNRIAEKSDWKVHAKQFGKYPAQANRAIQMLDTLARSAVEDTGIGVDEYDARTDLEQKYRGYRKENGAVIRNLCEREKAGMRSVYDCMHALREETRHALAERRANPDDYIEFQTESDETLAVLREQDERAMQ